MADTTSSVAAEHPYASSLNSAQALLVAINSLQRAKSCLLSETMKWDIAQLHIELAQEAVKVLVANCNAAN